MWDAVEAGNTHWVGLVRQEIAKENDEIINNRISEYFGKSYDKLPLVEKHLFKAIVRWANGDPERLEEIIEALKDTGDNRWKRMLKRESIEVSMGKAAASVSKDAIKSPVKGKRTLRGY